MKKPRIICRCKEITEEDIIAVIDRGIRDLDGVKRALGTGMGLCQGKTCGPLIARIISRRTGIPVSEVKTSRSRPPVRPLPIKTISES